MGLYIARCCDWCEKLGLLEVPAEVERSISVNGPPRTVMLCGRCDLALEPFLGLYEVGSDRDEAAVDDEPRRKKNGRKKARKKARAAEPDAGRDLEQPDPAPAAQPEPAPADPAPPAGDTAAEGSTLRRGGRVRDTSKPSIVCPLDHPHSGTGPMQITYSGRASHADMVHKMRFTQIRWQDPDGILTVPCTEHAECVDHEVAFSSPAGLTNHLASVRTRAKRHAAAARARPLELVPTPAKELAAVPA